MANEYLLDDVIINLLGLKHEESFLPVDQVLKIVDRAVRDLVEYKSYRIEVKKMSKELGNA